MPTMASERNLHLRIMAIGAVVICALIGETAFDSWQLHRQIMAANNRELRNLARSLSTDVGRSMQSIDLLLRDTAVWVEDNAGHEPTAAIDAALAARIATLNQVSTLTVTDANGRQVYRGGQATAPLSDVSDRPYFKVQREQPAAGIYVNAPVVTRGAGVAALVISRRIEGPTGRFDGIVAATVTLQHLNDAYQAIELGGSTTVLLTRADGTLVIRLPETGGLAENLKIPEFAQLRAGAPIYRMTSPIDGRPKLIAAVGIGQMPLILGISRDEGEALRPWVEELWRSAIQTVLLTLVTVLTIAGVLRQLRRQEAASLALRESENRFAMAMEAANEGHAEWNVAKDALFLSTKWRALHGLGAHEDVLTAGELKRRIRVHDDDIASLKGAIEDHLADRSRAIEVDYRVKSMDGEWHWIHMRGRCLRDAAGEPQSLFCSAIDISDRKRVESERASFESRLQQTRRLEALGTLAGGIAHDFNNILGAILGFGEMAQQRADEGTALRRHIDRVMQSGARARLLVRRILDFSRSGVVERTQVNVQAVAEEVIAMLAPTLAPTMAVETRLEAGDAAVTGDATQLYQVAMNLCTNAVHAMGDEGRLGITLERRQLSGRTSLLQGDLSAGAYVRLEVTDTGTGIPPDVLARMFDPFFTTKKGGEGTGLGLSVVHGIVSDMGGAIDVAARGDRGTSVSVWLPISGELAHQQAPRASEWPTGHGEVVMVVDDEEALVEMAEELLAGLGYEPVGYRSAEAALAAFEASPDRFDAVLTDQMLPGMTGSELAQRILAIRPGVPVILMSGNISEPEEQRARDSGVMATLHKPLGLQELATRLAALFPH